MNACENLLTANGYIYNTLFKIDEFRAMYDAVRRAYFTDEKLTTDDECRYFTSLYGDIEILLNMMRNIVVVHCDNELRTAQEYLVQAIDALNANPERTPRNGAKRGKSERRSKAADNVDE